MTYRNTREVAQLLNVTPARLSRALWERKFEPPAKGPGNSYLWEDDDIHRAARALLRRDIDVPEQVA